MEPTVDFFISRAGVDKDVAITVARILNAAGYTTILQDDDFGHASFMARMAQGWSSGARLLCLLSRDYQKSEYCKKEYEVALKDDPRNLAERVIVLRISECAAIEHLADLAYTDLVPLLSDATGFARAVRGAAVPKEKRDRKDADFAALYRRSPKQILHPEVRAVPGFTGREDELQALDAALWKKSGTAALTNATAAVKGLGGVGKSVLAQEYAWRNRDRYQGVWWIRAEKTETALDDLVALGSRFIAGLAEVPDRAQAAHTALDHIAQTTWDKPWLLVYDNVEKPGDVEKLTPTTGAHVLITTRWPDWHGRAEALPVGLFSPEQAVAFLLAKARRPEVAEAEALAKDLGHLPLALAHARDTAYAMNWSFAQYREHLPELIKKAPRDAPYPASVFATFDLAIQNAAAQQPQAETLIGLIAFLAPDRIPLDIFTEDVMSAIELGEAVAALSQVSLITPETLADGTPGISVHRLVQEVERGRLGSIEMRDEVAAGATRMIAIAYPRGHRSPADFRHWSACARLEAHAIAVLKTAPDNGEASVHTSLLLNQLGLNYASRAEHAEAEPLYRRAVAIDNITLGSDHPEVATGLNNLAELLRGLGRLSEAEPLYRRALAIDEAAVGSNDKRVAVRLGNLGLMMLAAGRHSEAEPLFRRALSICEAVLDPQHPNIATCANNLAGLLGATGRLVEAEPLYRRALAISEVALGREHPDVARALNNLAGLLNATGRRFDAIPLLQRALTIMETSVGPTHPNTATVRSNLAALLAVKQ